MIVFLLLYSPSSCTEPGEAADDEGEMWMSLETLSVSHTLDSSPEGRAFVQLTERLSFKEKEENTVPSF